MNLLDGIPTQTRQLCYISNSSDTAEIYDKTFQKSCVMFFGIGKTKARLFYNTAFFALKPGDFNDKLNFPITDRQCFESACNLPKPDDTARFTVRTLEIITVDRAVENGFAAKKSVLMCCTEVTPKV